jgi:3-keto-5-aminohexanoate cleavage enzyme
MFNDPVWLEVALNGGAGLAYQPNIPITPEAIIAEGVACAKAGAAIIHLHVYDDDGKPFENADRYSQIIESIRQQCDAIIYPTLGLGVELHERLEPIKILAQRGLLEWGVVDPGSVNITHTSQIAAKADGFLYSNPDSDIRALLELAASDNWRPAYAIYEPGFARLGKAMADSIKGLRSPVYRVMFSDGLLFGMTPSEAALSFYAQHLAVVAAGAPWMISGLDANIEGIIPLAIELGAHIRVGLEDAPFGCQQSNLELVEQTAAIIVKSGRSLATAQQVRNSG